MKNIGDLWGLHFMGPGTTGKTIDAFHNPFSIAIALLIFLSSLVSEHCPNLGKRKVILAISLNLRQSGVVSKLDNRGASLGVRRLVFTLPNVVRPCCREAAALRGARHAKRCGAARLCILRAFRIPSKYVSMERAGR